MRSDLLRCACAACLVLTTLTLPLVTRAQSSAETEARLHYERGVALFDESQFDAALAEFEAAHALTSRPSLLFNIGQIHARLGHAVESTEAFSRYLAEARDIAPERRVLVETELATQRARIARVLVNVDVEGALLSIDDVERGTSPAAAPISIGAGEHVLVVAADGHETSRQRFRIAGGEERTIDVHLVRTVVPPSERPQLPSAGAPFPVLTVIGAVVGGIGLVTWVTGGALTLSEDARLDSLCAMRACAESDTGTIEVSRIVADVGLGVLGVGAALTLLGVLLELTGSNDRQSEVRASLGPGGWEVSW